MRPVTRLKAGALVFTVLWTGWMRWWSGSSDAANIVMLAICGGLAGYLWYRLMRYWLIDRTNMQR